MSDQQFLTPPEVAVTSRLAALTKHPSWPDLRAHYEQKRALDEARFGRQLIRGGVPVDQREADYRRGYWAGIFHLLDTPARAEEQLERAMLNGKEQ